LIRHIAINSMFLGILQQWGCEQELPPKPVPQAAARQFHWWKTNPRPASPPVSAISRYSPPVQQTISPPCPWQSPPRRVAPHLIAPATGLPPTIGLPSFIQSAAANAPVALSQSDIFHRWNLAADVGDKTRQNATPIYIILCCGGLFLGHYPGEFETVGYIYRRGQK